MGKKSKTIPYCHGEPMQPIYRYKENGKIEIVYRCNFCGNKEQIEEKSGK